MPRVAYTETAEQRALRLRVLALRRRPRPMHSRGDKHAWVSEFMALYDARAWEAMQPAETRLDYLGAWHLIERRVQEYRVYLKVFAAAVEAGASPYHLRFVPVLVVYRLKGLMDQPNRLIEELIGSPAAAERRRKVHNRAARTRTRRPPRTAAGP